MIREILEKLRQKWLTVSRKVLPLTVGEWLFSAAYAFLFLLLCASLYLGFAAPEGALTLYWRLKFSSFFAPLPFPEGSFLTSSALVADFRAAANAEQLVSFLRRADACLSFGFPLFTFIVAVAWSSAKGHIAGTNEHIRGMRIESPRHQTGEGKELGLLPFGPVFLPRKLEERHVLVAGERGERSRVFLRQLEAIRRAGLPAVVHDPEGEYLARFYRPGVDLIVNPLDDRSLSWNFFSDITTAAGLSAFAGALFPAEPECRDLLRGILVALMVGGRKKPSDLGEALSLSRAELHLLVHSAGAGNSVENLLGSSCGREGGAALSRLRERLSWLEFEREEGDFSLRRWISDPGDSFLFLTSAPRGSQILRPYHALFLEELTGALRSLSDPLPRRLFVVLDEFSELSGFPSAGALMSRSGALGATVLLGVEDLASLELRYNPASVQTILNRCGTVLALRLPDGKSADYFSWRFGDTEYWDERDPRGEASEVPWSLAPKCGRLLLASEFLLLEERAGYLLMPGRHPLRVGISEEEGLLAPQVPRFLPRDGLVLEAPAAIEESLLRVRLGEEGPPGCPLHAVQPHGGRPLTGRLEF